MLFQVFYRKHSRYLGHQLIAGSHQEQRQDVEDMIESGELVFLTTTQASNPEDAFHNMQGEVWSPNGEARELIRSRGLRHTSMSSGDVLQHNRDFYVVDSFGFLHLQG